MEMDKLFTWFCANKLSLNPKTTKYILLRTPKHTCDVKELKMEIDKIPLSRIGTNCEEKSTKFLGVHLDEHLSWIHHLKHVNKKISMALYSLKQVKFSLPLESLKTLYFSMIHPHICYGILAWGNAKLSAINKTVLLQKRAIRTINRVACNSHTDPLFKNMNILKVADQYQLEVVLFMHKYVNKKLPPSFDRTFQFNHELLLGDRVTRQSVMMHIDRFESEYARRLPLFNFPTIWNKWHNQISLDKSLLLCKKAIKQHIMSSYNDQVKCLNPLCQQCVNR